MKKLLTAFVISLFLLPTVAVGGGQKEKLYLDQVIDAKGHLYIVGGGQQPDYMLERFMSLAGKGKKHVLVIPFASKDYKKVENTMGKRFRELGAASFDIITSDKADLDSPENIKKMRKANVIYFSGGSQTKLSRHMLNSQLYHELKKRYKEGAAVGGTSAGAAIWSDVMITGGDRAKVGKNKFVNITPGAVVTRKGFGFLENIIIDQHFLYRKRANRLFAALMDNPGYRGVGIDESTAIIVKPNGTFEAFGESRVLVVEPAFDLNDNYPIFTVKILSSGDEYKL